MTAGGEQPLKDRLKRAWKFVSEDVWDIELSSLSIRRRFGVNTIRVLQLVWRGFREDECPLHASALTFSTLMSIVPILALSLAMARGLGGADAAKSWIRARVNDWTGNFERIEVEASRRGWGMHSTTGGVAVVVATTNDLGAAVVDMRALSETNAPAASTGGTDESGDELDAAALAARINRLVESGFEKIDHVSFGALGGVGLVLLMWMVIAVLGRVEASFNRVWGVTVERSLWRKFTDYLSILFVLPLLLVAASSFPIADFATRFVAPDKAHLLREILNSSLLKHVMVYGMTSLAFAFLIMFMPNTKVRAGAGLTGGLVAGVLFLIWLWVCAALQVGAARAGRIYGSFAVLPILLAWVNVSWQIVFLGAEVAFAVQNCATYRMEQGATRASVQARLTLALSIVLETARSMMRDEGPFLASNFARVKNIPVRFLLGILDELVKAGFLAEVAEKPGHYVLLRTPDALPLREIVERVLQSGVDPEALGLGSLRGTVEGIVGRVNEGVRASLQEMSVRDLVEQTATISA